MVEGWWLLPEFCVPAAFHGALRCVVFLYLNQSGVAFRGPKASRGWSSRESVNGVYLKCYLFTSIYPSFPSCLPDATMFHTPYVGSPEEDRLCSRGCMCNKLPLAPFIPNATVHFLLRTFNLSTARAHCPVLLSDHCRPEAREQTSNVKTIWQMAQALQSGVDGTTSAPFGTVCTQ